MAVPHVVPLAHLPGVPPVPGGGCWGPADDRPPLVPDPSRPAHLAVVVDTEEEFDWNHPGDSSARSVSAIAALPYFHELCRAYGLVPTYVVTWPVLASDRASGLLASWWKAGEARLGIHLHAWVTPPFEEPTEETFQANLPAELERAKLDQLCTLFRERFAIAPVIHKAGRYGIGSQTLHSLVDLGITIDTSLSPPFDYRDRGGPDFRHTPVHPCWLVPGRLFAIPTTGGYRDPWLRRAARVAGLGRMVPSLRAALPTRLSPEGGDFPSLKDLTRRLFRQGVRDFTLSLHSPSLQPGCTPYVRDVADRQLLMDTCRRYLRWFAGEFGGRLVTVEGMVISHWDRAP